MFVRRRDGEMILARYQYHCLRKEYQVLLGWASHKEPFTDVNTELGPDGLDGRVDLLLMSHQCDVKLYQLVEAQPGHLLHGSDAGSCNISLVIKSLTGDRSDVICTCKVVAVSRHLETCQPVVHGTEPCEVWGVWSQRVGGLAGSDLPQRLRAADQFVQSLDNAGECRPVSSLLLPAVQHQLVDCLWTVHWCWQSVALNS